MAASAAAGNNDYTTEITSALNTANHDGNGGTSSLGISPAAAADATGARLRDGGAASATADTGDTDDSAGIANAAPNLHDKPTTSHALATADHEEKGAAQKAHAGDENGYYASDEREDEDGRGVEVAGEGQGQGYGTDVKDLGWHDDVEQVPRPLVAGMSNEELWMLIRRFDKVWEEHRKCGRDVHFFPKGNVPGMKSCPVTPFNDLSPSSLGKPVHCVPACIRSSLIGP
jgi:hypothetical protein